jgi:digeranylgeranylglycerophospholipid reductase
MNYDVIVVGAGPAGSTTALYAAKNNLNVLMVDKKKDIGYPVQCGEFVPTIDEVQKIVPKAEGLEELFEIDNKLISKRTEGIRIFSPKGKQFVLNFRGFSIDRGKFDSYLAKKATDYGAQLKTDTKVMGFNGKKITTNQGDFSGKIFVCADGPSSKMARWGGLQGPKTLAPCLVCNIPGDFEPMVDMYFGKIAPGGFAWIIPKEGGANVGLGIPKGSKAPLKGLLNNFLESISVDLKTISMQAAPVPISGPIPKTVKNNIVVVGDSAGHIMATNGGGIPIAMICGRIAGNVIGDHFNNDTPLQRYESEWRRVIGKELKTALKTKRLADFFFRWDPILEMAMVIMGIKRMNRAIKCKPIFHG